ncbi:MAG: hypothetical protein U5O15_02685 [Candidatus Krumholzibacteriota bacterium]|nr:hypothetical protein [Candidatus Krumholzibacteriota bacterium]
MYTGIKAKKYIKENWEIALVVLLLLMHMFFLKFSFSIGYYPFLFLFFFFSIILLPGYLFTKTIFGDLDLPGYTLLSFLFGTVFTFLLLMIFALFHLDIFFIGILMPALSLFLALFRKIISSSFTKAGLVQFDLPGFSTQSRIILLFLLIFVVILIIGHGDPLMYTSDSVDHIGYIKRVSISHNVFPEQYLYKDGGMLTNDIRKGLMHAVWGTINLLTGHEDVVIIWPLISAISSTFIILALFCAGWFIFRSAATGLIAAFLFVFIHGGGLTSYRLITAAFSFPIGRIFSLVFLFSILGFLKNNKKIYLALIAGASIAATGTHIGHFVVDIFILCVLIIAKFIENSPTARKKLITKTAPLIAAITIVVNIPYLLMRYLRDYAPNNEIHTHLQGIFSITENLYTVNPVTLYQQTGVLSIIAFISIFILWKQSKNEENLRLLLWGTIAIWGVMFNPILIPPLMKVISYLVMRLTIALPASLITAVLIKTLWEKLKGRSISISKGAAIIGCVAIIVFIGYQLAITPPNFAYSKTTGLKPEYSCLNISDLYNQINEKVPDGSVIASDPMTSYCIPAFTNQFVICTNSQHSTPNDSTALQRIMDCRDIFSFLTPMSDIAKVLTKYQAEYIVVNGKIPVSTGTLYWKPDNKMAMETINRFSEYPTFFKLLYKDNNTAIFKITDKLSSSYVTTSGKQHEKEYIGNKITKIELSKLTPSETPGIFIKSIHPHRQIINKGDKLKLDVKWVAGKKLDYGSYLSYIRFDTDFDKGLLFHKWYGKIYRKILERVRGQRFRFRIGHLPLNGIFTPDKWPPMHIINDSMFIDIPEDIASGEYTISVKMSVRTAYPNYSSKDLLNDDDSFDGPDMGKIIIE